jgi:hypothetical protein
MCFTLFKVKRLLQPRLPTVLQMSEHPKHMSLRSRMNSGTFVQYTIDRGSAQTCDGDNFTYTYGSPNLHISIRTVFRLSSPRQLPSRLMAMSTDSTTLVAI